MEYLHCNHSVYMKIGSSVYYLTDCNYESWRAQDTSRRNEKNHFVDCSELVPTVDEFLALPLSTARPSRTFLITPRSTPPSPARRTTSCESFVLS